MAIIDKPTDHFETITYTGTGSSNAITELDFQPDWVWIKSRTAAEAHRLHDSVRGANKLLRTHGTFAEATTSQDVMSFDSNGFTVGTETAVNNSGKNIVSWNWKAGTSFTNDASATGIGSFDSTGSVNTDAGFSVISYTGNGSGGATVAHGLGSVPYMYIVKRRNSTGNWHTYHVSNGANGEIRLNLAEAFFTTDIWQDTAPTSSVFSLGASIDVNASGGTYIAYCFAEKQGYSKFGSYTGNGSATDGTFVYTGFKPAFVMLKRTDGTASWYIYDNKRDVFNAMTRNLFPDGNYVEDNNTNNNLDFLSNGFKIRTTSGARNASGGSYIYMAFAEQPLVGDNPATAR